MGVDQLKKIRSLIIDMDGVLYRGDTPIPGLVEFFDFIRSRGIRYLLATNNSTRPPRLWAEKLAGMGVTVSPDEIMTSATATAQYLVKEYPAGTPMYYVGEMGLREALEEAGFVIDEDKAEVVVTGMDRTLTYDKLAKATLRIRAGARFIGTNPDRTLPMPYGEIPGAGSIQAALVVSTSGVQPFIVGKPEPHMFGLALDKLGTSKAETAVLGDHMDTDMTGARRAGLYSILVLTGVATREEAEGHPCRPDLMLADITELVQVWGRVLDSKE